jgi:opacity protein-like surface antigen
MSLFDAGAVNYLAIIVSAILAQAIGFIWYQPFAFGTLWSKYTGRSMSDMGSNPGIGYALTFVGSLIMAWVLAEILRFSAATTLPGGYKMAFIVWLGFVATTGFANSFFVGKKRELFILEQAHHLVVLLVMATVLVLWR